MKIMSLSRRTLGRCERSEASLNKINLEMLRFSQDDLSGNVEIHKQLCLHLNK